MAWGDRASATKEIAAVVVVHVEDIISLVFMDCPSAIILFLLRCTFFKDGVYTVITLYLQTTYICKLVELRHVVLYEKSLIQGT